MASVLLIIGGSTMSPGTGATYYHSVAEGESSGVATEANNQTVWRTAGTFSKARIYLTLNNATSASTLTLKKNGSNANITASLTALTTGIFEDAVNSDSISAGDTYYYSLINGGGGTVVPSYIQIVFVASSDTSKRYSSSGSALAGVSTTVYFTIANLRGNAGSLTSETTQRTKSRGSGTLKNLFVFISTNTRTTTTTIKSRKNAADGNLTVSVGSTTTGIFEDTTNSDTIAIDDIIDWAIVLGSDGSHNLVIDEIASDIITSDSTYLFLSKATVTLFTATSYSSIGGLITGGATRSTEDPAKNKFNNSGGTLSKLSVQIATNSFSTTSSCTTRINGSNGNLTVSIPTVSTGFFDDTTNSDTIAINDDVNYIWISPSEFAELVANSISLLLTPAGGGGTDTGDEYFIITS
jgi:hypothetical protein